MEITINNAQAVCTALGKRRRRELVTSDEYIRMLDNLQNSSEDVRLYINHHMRKRMDQKKTRSLGVFGERIMASSISEEKEVTSWVPVYASRHFEGGPFLIKPNGVGPHGCIIIEEEKLEFKAPDSYLSHYLRKFC